jgi:CheY-like chemotaxis protein
VKFNRLQELPVNAASPSSPRPLRILLVDDNRDAADSMAVILRFWGHEVNILYSGANVLAQARAIHPDLMILDIGLPGLDGLTLARQVRQDAQLRETPLIALTAYSVEQEAMAAGFNQHLTKPADAEVLHRLLDQLQRTNERLNRSEETAQQQLQATEEAVDLIQQVQADVKEVKDELRQVQQDVAEIKDELQDAKKKSASGS